MENENLGITDIPEVFPLGTIKSNVEPLLYFVPFFLFDFTAAELLLILSLSQLIYEPWPSNLAEKYLSFHLFMFAQNIMLALILWS